jgi:hypothetical protein
MRKICGREASNPVLAYELELLINRANFVAWLPIGWTQATGSKRAHHAQGLADAAAYVYGTCDSIGDYPVGIEDKRRTHRDLFVFVQHTVMAREIPAFIREQWIANST